MNCEQGDIALWVSHGVLVDVICPAMGGEIFTSVCGKHRWQVIHDGAVPAWIVQILGTPQYRNSQPKHVLWSRMAVYDRSLVPIRDHPGSDESFRWAPSPTQKELA